MLTVGLQVRWLAGCSGTATCHVELLFTDATAGHRCGIDSALTCAWSAEYELPCAVYAQGSGKSVLLGQLAGEHSSTVSSMLMLSTTCDTVFQKAAAEVVGEAATELPADQPVAEAQHFAGSSCTFFLQTASCCTSVLTLA
jgi:hypothetical protein